MSLSLMVSVMQDIEVTRPQQAVLLAMAEHANDDGTSCFPSVDRIAWKAGYKPRAVEDIMRTLREEKIIVEAEAAHANKPTEYEIHLEAAPKKLPFEEWRKLHGKHRGAKNAPVQSHGRGVQSHEKTTRENAPEPSTKPSIEPSEKNTTYVVQKENVAHINAEVRELSEILQAIEGWDKQGRKTLELIGKVQTECPGVDHLRIANELKRKIALKSLKAGYKEPSRTYKNWCVSAQAKVEEQGAVADEPYYRNNPRFRRMD